jgi:hypothetical protein
VAAGGLSGLTLSLDLQTEKDYWLGTYEPDLQQAIQDLVQPGMIAYDVGANIGYISLLLGLAVGKDGHVFAFEALPANVERLQKNLRLNYGRPDNYHPYSCNRPDSPVKFLSGPSVQPAKRRDRRAGQPAYHRRCSKSMG